MFDIGVALIATSEEKLGRKEIRSKLGVGNLNFFIVMIRVIDHFRVTPKKKKCVLVKFIAKVKKLNIGKA